MKTLTIIKAIGAGVTALYNAVESAKYANDGAEAEARQAANEWRYAVTDMRKAIEELQPKHKPYHFNGAGRAMPVFHDSDES